VLNHPILKKRTAYESKSSKETAQKEGKDSSKVLQSTKKIKKVIVSPKARAAKVSVEKESATSPVRKLDERKSRAEIIPGEADNMRRIRRLVKAKDNEEILFENWICCDECGKWRKIDDENLWSKLQGKPKILCKNLPAVVCGSPEENWKQT